MKTLLCLPLLLLASCAEKIPPRAILPPPVEITAVDTAPVENQTALVTEATEKVSLANQKAAAANQAALTTSAKLSAAISRAEVLTAGNDLLRDAWQEAEAFATTLGNELLATRTAMEDATAETDQLRTISKTLATQVSTLKATAAVNQTQTTAAREENKTLRAQLTQADQIRDSLIAETARHHDLKSRQKWLWGAIALLATSVLALLYLTFKP